MVNLNYATAIVFLAVALSNDKLGDRADRPSAGRVDG